MTTPDTAPHAPRPEIAAAFALKATSGAYAVLLGSGVSRSAQIPTGWEVMVDLCRRVAAANGDEPSDALAWYRTSLGATPAYDDILARLTETPEERIGLLRGYFEPSEQDRADGLKLPTPAHHSIASLVEKGLVKVVLTTNFDRLMERALDARNTPYVVTATPSAVEGALPLHLQTCQIVKLHGDYLDPGFLNTPEELSSYEPAMDRLLDRVLDEYGLIVMGWSATYDPALRAALERCTTRRFSSWWVSPGELSEHARRLLELRSSTHVAETADLFMVNLEDAVSGLERVERPQPQSLAIASASAKRSLSPAGDKIRLHDDLKREMTGLASKPQVTRTVFGMSASADSVRQEVVSLEAQSQTALLLVAAATDWGDDESDAWWLPQISAFASRFGAPPASGLSKLIELSRYPAFLIFHTSFIAAVAGRRWNLVNTLLELELEDDRERDLPVEVLLDPTSFFSEQVFERPLAHLEDVLRPLFVDYLYLTLSDFAAAFESSDYLLTLHSDLVKEKVKANPAPDTVPGFFPIRSTGLQLPERHRSSFRGARTPRVSVDMARLLSAMPPGLAGGALDDDALWVAVEAMHSDYQARSAWH